MIIYRAPVVVPVSAPPIRDGGVAVADGRILAVGPMAELPSGEQLREFEGVLTPGLVNAHTHLCFSAYADHYGNGKEFFEWIQDFGRRNPTMTEQDWRRSTQVGIDACLRAGVTGMADVVTPAAALPVLLASNMAGSVYFEVCGPDAPGWKAERDQFIEILEVAAAARGATADPMLGISPHTLYTLARAVGGDLAAIARERGIRLHPHLAETRHEDEYVRQGSGAFAEFNRRLSNEYELLAGGCGTSPAAEMAEWGLLGADSHVAHGVHLDAADRALLAAHGTAVALCARSNARLDAGEPPVAAHRAEGNPIAVGTDSLASSPDLDVAAELPVLRDIAIRQGDSGEGLDEWLLRAAPQGGALAMGRKDFGVLEPGARADFAVFDLEAGNDPYAAVVAEAAGACTATVLAGELVER